MYKEDLGLNNQQWLICLKTKPNQTKIILSVCQLTAQFKGISTFMGYLMSKPSL